MTTIDPLDTREDLDLDLIIIGAGFAGMMALHHARGLGLRTVVLEAGDDVGGTWYWNRYPGLTCDIESYFYSYSFDEQLQQEWEWRDRYATQEEILSYARHVADRFALRSGIRFGTRVVSQAYDETALRWSVIDEHGVVRTARFVIMATGVLSAPKEMRLEGEATFGGQVLRTTHWPDGVDLTGKKVAVLGTGSTGIQVSTEIADKVEHLYVLQRTPSFSVPNHNRPLDPAQTAEVKANYPALRAHCRTTLDGLILPGTGRNTADVPVEEQLAILEDAWADGRGFRFDVTFEDTLLDDGANRVVADFLASKIRQLVDDPETARRLTPSGYPFGTRRICMDAGYYAIFNRPTTTLVDLRETPLVGLTATGVQTTTEHLEVDAVVLATGYDAVTGALSRIEIVGRDGRRLSDHWAEGARTMKGIAVAGFPNLFLITGPLSPSVFTNVIASIEQHVEWLTTLLEHAKAEQLDEIEALPEAEEAWVRHSDELAASTLHTRGTSWFSGANVEGKPRRILAYVGGLGAYGEHLAAETTQDYPGFALRRVQTVGAAHSDTEEN